MGSNYSDRLLKQTAFTISVTNMQNLPTPCLPEVCFIGRSNVGKSSLINALVNKHQLARVSCTPGRTQQINYFRVADYFYLVDLPGYGFAKAPVSEVRNWTRLIEDYLRMSVNIVCVNILIDARRGLMPIDMQAIALLENAGRAWQFILTKQDKIPFKALPALEQQLLDVLEQSHYGCETVSATSSSKGIGIKEMRQDIVRYVHNFVERDQTSLQKQKEKLGV